MTEPEHPLTTLRRGRDAVVAAAARQAMNPRPSLEELDAFGAAVVSTLASLGHLSSILAEQVGRFDDEELERVKTSDEPADKLRIAGTHLWRLGDTLASALKDANRYWNAVESADQHTKTDVRARGEPDV